MVCEVRVERDRVARTELVTIVTTDEHNVSRLHDSRFPAPGLVQWRVTESAGGEAGTKRMHGDRVWLSGKRSRQLLDVMSVSAHIPALGATNQRDVSLLIETQQS